MYALVSMGVAIIIALYCLYLYVRFELFKSIRLLLRKSPETNDREFAQLLYVIHSNIRHIGTYAIRARNEFHDKKIEHWVFVQEDGINLFRMSYPFGALSKVPDFKIWDSDPRATQEQKTTMREFICDALRKRFHLQPIHTAV